MSLMVGDDLTLRSDLGDMGDTNATQHGGDLIIEDTMQDNMQHAPEPSGVAANKVFHTPELLEMILMRTSIFTKFRVQRVCKTFKDAIESSSRLQQAMLLRPTEDRVAFSAGLHDFLHAVTLAPSRSESAQFFHDCSAYDQDGGSAAMLFAIDKERYHGLKPAGRGTWRRVLAGHSPIRQIRLWADTVEGGLRAYSVLEPGKTVTTLGEVFDVLDRAYTVLYHMDGRLRVEKLARWEQRARTRSTAR